ncbi:MAG: MFS transporter [Anaerolineales bacterium]|nr:MFS transporter [Anaerolineales bacterium]
MGMFGAAFGIGFILGPAMGGILSQYGFAVPAFVSAALAFINLLTVFFWLPESLTDERRAELATQKKANIPFAALAAALNHPKVGSLLWVRFGFAIAFNSFQTVFPLYVLNKFGLGAQQTGYILAYLGIVLVVMQGGLIGPLSARFKESNHCHLSWLCVGWHDRVGQSFPQFPLLLVAMFPMAVGAGSFQRAHQLRH